MWVDHIYLSIDLRFFLLKNQDLPLRLVGFWRSGDVFILSALEPGAIVVLLRMESTNCNAHLVLTSCVAHADVVDIHGVGPGLQVIGACGGHHEFAENEEQSITLRYNNDEFLAEAGDRVLPVQIRAARSIPVPHAALVRASAALKIQVTTRTGSLEHAEINVDEECRRLHEAVFLTQELHPPELSAGHTPATAPCTTPHLPSSAANSEVTSLSLLLTSTSEVQADVCLQLDTLLFLSTSTSAQDVQARLRTAFVAKLRQAAEAIQLWIRTTSALPTCRVTEPPACYPVFMTTNGHQPSPDSGDTTYPHPTEVHLRFWHSVLSKSANSPPVTGMEKQWPAVALHCAVWPRARHPCAHAPAPPTSPRCAPIARRRRRRRTTRLHPAGTHATKTHPQRASHTCQHDIPAQQRPSVAGPPQPPLPRPLPPPQPGAHASY